MRAPACALLILALAPVAGAQLGLVDPELAVFVEDPGRAFVPGAEEPVTVVVNYAPGNGARPTPAPTAEKPEATQPTRVLLAVKQQPSWVESVRLEPAEVVLEMPAESVTGSYRGSAIAYLLVKPDAPALEREAFLVEATAQPNGNIAGKTAVSPEVKLRATTVGLLNVTAEPASIVPGGRWTVVPFEVRNEGNSAIVAKLNVTVRPENSQVEFPETIELARGEARQVDVRIRTPWTAAETGSLELEAVPLVDGEEATPARAEVLVRGQSAVPGAPVAALVLALALVARLRR